MSKVISSVVKFCCDECGKEKAFDESFLRRKKKEMPDRWSYIQYSSGISYHHCSHRCRMASHLKAPSLIREFETVYRDMIKNGN